MKSNKTQSERVQALVTKKAKSIKQLAKETGFFEPNIRRILGQGTLKGTFERVSKGMYILKKNETDDIITEKCARCGNDTDEAYSSLWEGNFCAVCWHKKHDK